MAGNRPPGGWGHWEADTPLQVRFHETTKSIIRGEVRIFPLKNYDFREENVK